MGFQRFLKLAEGGFGWTVTHIHKSNGALHRIVLVEQGVSNIRPAGQNLAR